MYGFHYNRKSRRNEVMYTIFGIYGRVILQKSISFIHQTAFVGNFESTPILDCFKIDGIIGSNLMRHCNWTVDYQNKELTLTSNTEKKSNNEYLIIPFHTDQQYNILVNVGIGKFVVKNITVDYGSNGAISLPISVFNTLKQNKIIGETYIEEGVKQSGLFGEPKNLKREITYVDTIKIENLIIDDVEIKSESSGLIGEKILSRYVVTIDWKDMNLHLKEVEHKDNDQSTFGFRVGSSIDKGLFVQSVVKNSTAYNNGIRPNMLVLKIDTLNFVENHNFCDYVLYMNRNPKEMTIELFDLKGLTKSVYLEQARLMN